MENFYITSMYILILNIFIAFALSVYAWQRRNVQGARAFYIFTLTIVFWILCSVIASLSPTPESADLWFNKIRYVFIAALPIAQLIFVLQYTGRGEMITRWRIAGLSLLPIIIQAINWIYSKPFILSQGYEKIGPFWIEIDPSIAGPLFWLHTWYSYLVIGISLFLLIWHAIAQRYPYRSQAILILTGALFPLGANILSIFGIIRIVPPDFTAMSFAISSLIWAYALFRYRLLDIMPIARDLVIESMDDAIFVIDYQDRIIDLNTAAKNIVNLPLNEIMGKDTTIVLAPWQNLIEEFHNTPHAEAQVEIKVNNEEKVFNLRISPILQRDQLVGRLITLRDITEMQQLINELDAYAHTVAHDLKSPLGAAMGYTEILTNMYEDVLDEKALQMVGRMHDAYGKMREIIDELLLMARIRKEDINTQPLEMGALVKGALTRFTTLIEEKEATIITPPTAWPTAMGYPSWVEEVWANYIGNALKYGGTPLVIELGADTEVDGCITFWIKDNGAGLTEEQQADVFQQFTRYHAHTEGQGLGLAITKRILDKLGGQVGVESTVGEGSKFYFILPVE